MSQPVVHRPETPTLQPNSLQALHPSVLPEYADAPSDSSASTSECPCCTPSPLPDLKDLGQAIPECRLDTLEGQFQDSVSFQPTTEFSTQAVAIVPHDQQANGYWLLVNLLCHRVFDKCGDRSKIRNFSVFYYGKFGPGDLLMAVSRKITRDGPTWLEATVTRGGILVATATALYDKIHSDTMDDAQVQEANQR
ncbi:uncharacterized protein LDX57_007761 [Aspergillus melleus]|uniref:uncharacterized protein n=1 Tax=Aspergillus melleus TaxID=138277 RepID=UPI001E8D933A|nr:uncharacterized protein LDX57_007726 [Aspergillus melleus]XP_045945449.1 uncharacterized protein LDX57_007761 [Aspergillus melleus]KAH8430055.1 hypothetical protein LDX57_007726 [Aspergillus melleus]KAH8430091.1 hypothetical protein LDX57_007761 [Aspergillus melleus]